jgi:Domain of unknown function (DUF397)
MRDSRSGLVYAGMRGSANWGWRKSSYSGQGNCVEVAASRPGVVAVRDSKDPGGAVLLVSAESWKAFIRDTARGSLPLRRWG